jgi:hypothetical protein
MPRILSISVMAALLIGCTATLPSDEPVPTGGAPSVASIGPTATAGSEVGLSGAGLPTLTPPEIRFRIPTRVRIRGLGIDLAVVEPPDNPTHFPFCGVAEYLPAMSRPGQPGTTFLYAHARAGMFLPILEASRVDDGRSLLGLKVEVYTDDARRFTYEITEIRRHVDSLESLFRATTEQLVLQTSEGPRGTVPKVIVVAAPAGEQAVDPRAAAPTPKPIRCS